MAGSEFVARAKALAPMVAAAAPEAERTGAIPAPVIDAFCDASIMQLLVPKRYGGHELDYRTMAGVISAISPQCVSTAWVLAFYIGHNYIHALFPKESQDEVFADRPYALTPGTLAPSFRLNRTKGGYIATGRSAWNSGSSRADWYICNGILQQDGEAPAPRCFLVPSSDATLIPNWDVAGMRGTSSSDIELDQLFVPDHRAVDTMRLLEGRSPGAELHGNPLYQLPLLPFTMGEVMPVVVGAFRGAADEFRRLTEGRMTTFSGTAVSSKQSAQIRIGRSQAGVTLAEAMLRDYADILSDTDLDTLKTPETRAALKARCALMTEYCCDGINEIMRGAGAGAFRNSSPLQRFFRDINMLRVHGFLDVETGTETYGRLLLGQPLTAPI